MILVAVLKDKCHKTLGARKDWGLFQEGFHQEEGCTADFGAKNEQNRDIKPTERELYLYQSG